MPWPWGPVAGSTSAAASCPRLLDFFVAYNFRQGFEAKGRFSAYLSQAPTWVITSPMSPAL